MSLQHDILGNILYSLNVLIKKRKIPTLIYPDYIGELGNRTIQRGTTNELCGVLFICFRINSMLTQKEKTKINTWYILMTRPPVQIL